MYYYFRSFVSIEMRARTQKRGGEVKSEMTTVIGGRMLSKYQPPEGTVEPRGDAYDRNAPLQRRALLLTKRRCLGVTTVTDFADQFCF